MKDFARSDHAGVQAQLDRLGALSAPQGRLGLETVRALLARIGDPQRSLPPVFHVAGTNGKGSTCAFLRAMLEAEGYTVHATTSPHLVRYNERIRVAGRLIEDDALAALLAEVLDAGEDLAPSFFEVTIAAAFLAFARTPADACVVEVGLGGRFDATNLIAQPAVCGIASLGIDHERFLLAPEKGVPTEPPARIAFEKAGIAKPGVPLVTLDYPEEALEAVATVAERAGAVLRDAGRWWFYGHGVGQRVGYRDEKGALFLPPPALFGEHQYANAALAAAMIRHQQVLSVSVPSLKLGTATAKWPARLQQLARGPLTQCAPDARWLLDGGHNAQAADMLAAHFASADPLRRHAVIGMLEAKDWRGFLARVAPHFTSLVAVPVPGHDSADPEAVAAHARALGIEAQANTLDEALSAIPQTDEVFLGGSLYLAGEILRRNGEYPD